MPSQSPDGNSFTTLVYTFTDAQPLPGAGYYRLRQTDINGTVNFSQIIALTQDSTAPVLHPNPPSASGEAVLEPAIVHIGYALVNAQGRVLQHQDTPGVLSRVSLSGQPSGVYLLQVRTEAGPVLFRVLK